MYSEFIIRNNRVLDPERIGGSDAAEVFRGEYCGQSVIFKHIYDEVLFQHELKVVQRLKRLSLPQVVRFSDWDSETNVIWMEDLSRGSLQTLLDSSRRTWNDMSVFSKYRLASSICNGVSLLHKHGILHGDIKPANVLIDENDMAVLCDFGSALLINDLVVMPRTLGTPGYVASEAIEKGVNAPNSDVYSLGVTLWSFLFGRVPYEKINSYAWPIGKEMNSFQKKAMDMTLARLEGEPPGDIPANAPKALKKLIESCWETRPGLRPSVEICLTTLEYVTLQSFYSELAQAEDTREMGQIESVPELCVWLIEHADQWIHGTTEPLELVRKVDFLFECAHRHSLDYVVDSTGPVFSAYVWKGKKVSPEWAALVGKAKQSILQRYREDEDYISAAEEPAIKAFLGAKRTGGLLGGTFFGGKSESLIAFEALKAEALPPEQPRPMW